MTLDGWSNKTIGELCNFSNGYGFRPPDWSKEGLPIIRIQNLNGSKEFNYFNGIPDESWLVEPGTILFAWAGMPGVSFGPTIWNGPRGVLNQHIYRIHPHKGINPLWLCAALEIATKNIEQNAHGFKTTLLHVRKEEITSQVVHLPPPCEQQKIVAVLSDTDSLIESLDKLITKKRDIKQATMQQLLTGKTRLPGFSGESEVKKLEDIADKNVQWSITGGPFGSNLKTVDYTSDGVRIIQLQNIGDGVFHDDYKIYTSEEKADELISCNIYPGEIILSKMGDPVARACIIPNGDRRYLMASDGIRLVVNKKCFDKQFVHDYINSIYFRKKAIEASTGSTRQRIGLEDLKKLPFVAPPLLEQQAIAVILSDMEAEITALERKRDKTRALKQGMMQELLTGKTRLL